jgi:hypothetical protein
VLKFLLAALRPFRIPKRQALESSQEGGKAAGGGPGDGQDRRRQGRPGHGRRGKKRAAFRFTLSRTTSNQKLRMPATAGFARKWTRVRSPSLLDRAIWISFVTGPDLPGKRMGDGCWRMAAEWIAAELKLLLIYSRHDTKVNA